MPPVGFEPTNSAGVRPQTYTLEPVATGTGNYKNIALEHISVSTATSNSAYKLQVINILLASIT